MLQKALILTLLRFYWTATRGLGLQGIHGHEARFLKYALSTSFLLDLLQFLLGVDLLLFIFGAAMLRTRWRFMCATPGMLRAIGHLAADFDCYFKEQILTGRDVKLILIGDTWPVANETLFGLWSSRMVTVKNRLLLRFAKRITVFWPSLTEPVQHYSQLVRGPGLSGEIIRQWGDRAPLLNLDQEMIARGEARLCSMGVPAGAWFVCVHSRESGYAPDKEWSASYRNSDILDYVQAMKWIVAAGGWCIRVGDKTMKPLPPIEGVIDYAHSPFKEDWMDLFLCARCRLFLGNTSGLFLVAAVFGRPSALANLAPMGTVYVTYPNCLGIPKLFRNETGRILTFPELFASELSEYRYTYEFEKAGVQAIDNTPDEIEDLVKDAFNYLDADLKSMSDNGLQASFRSLIKPHHYCWYSKSQIANSFLERHCDLLGDSEACRALSQIN